MRLACMNICCYLALTLHCVEFTSDFQVVGHLLLLADGREGQRPLSRFDKTVGTRGVAMIWGWLKQDRAARGRFLKYEPATPVCRYGHQGCPM